MRFQIRFLSLLFVAAITVIVVVLHGIELPATSGVTRELVDATHAPGFGLVAVGALLFFRLTKTPAMAYFFAFAFATLLAIIAEATQIPGPRNADVGDLGHGLVGIGGFLALAACLDPKTQPFLAGMRRPALFSIGALAALVALFPLVHSARVVFSRAQAMPVVAAFDQHWEAAIYRPLGGSGLSRMGRLDDWPTGGTVLVIDLAPVRYSGLSIDPYPDWSAYQSISFLAASGDGREHRITLRIHDANHNWEYEDRFNASFVFGPEVKRYEVPLTDLRDAVDQREFDLTRVADMTFFKVNASEGERILIDDIRLR